MSFPGNNMNPMMNDNINPMMNNNANPMMNNDANPMMNNNMNPMMNNNMNPMMNNNMNPLMNNMNISINPMMSNIMINNINNMNQMPNNMMNNNQMPMNNNFAQMNSQIMQSQMFLNAPIPMQVMASNLNNPMGNINPQMANANFKNQNQPQHQDKNLSLTFINPSIKASKIIVPCTQDEVFSEVVKRYWSKVQIEKPPKSKFIFNTKNIALSLTVAESGLIPDSVIQVVITEGVDGA